MLAWCWCVGAAGCEAALATGWSGGEASGRDGDFQFARRHGAVGEPQRARVRSRGEAHCFGVTSRVGEARLCMCVLV
jgi:hypothetical protein